MIEQIQAYFSSPKEMKKLEEQVLKRKKKRVSSGNFF